MGILLLSPATDRQATIYNRRRGGGGGGRIGVRNKYLIIVDIRATGISQPDKNF